MFCVTGSNLLVVTYYVLPKFVQQILATVKNAIIFAKGLTKSWVKPHTSVKAKIELPEDSYTI